MQATKVDYRLGLIADGKLDCTDCKAILPLSQFCKSVHRLHGYKGVCRQCSHLRYRALLKKNGGPYKKNLTPAQRSAAAKRYHKAKKARLRWLRDYFALQVCSGSLQAFLLQTGLIWHVLSGGQPEDFGRCRDCAEFLPVAALNICEARRGVKRYRCKPCDNSRTRRRSAMRPLLIQRIVEQSGKCFYCGLPGLRLGIEHRLPVSRGGTDDPENIVAACRGCNSAKGQKTTEEYSVG